MAKRVTFNGTQYNFPDDATDEEMVAAIGAQAAPDSSVAPRARQIPWTYDLLPVAGGLIGGGIGAVGGIPGMMVGGGLGAASGEASKYNLARARGYEVPPLEKQIPGMGMAGLMGALGAGTGGVGVRGVQKVMGIPGAKAAAAPMARIALRRASGAPMGFFDAADIVRTVNAIRQAVAKGATVAAEESEQAAGGVARKAVQKASQGASGVARRAATRAASRATINPEVEALQRRAVAEIQLDRTLTARERIDLLSKLRSGGEVARKAIYKKYGL